MKSSRRICILLLAGVLVVEALRPKPSFESVILQAIDDLNNTDAPRIEGQVSVLKAFDPLLTFFRTTMAPPTSSRLFDSRSLQEKSRSESEFTTSRPNTSSFYDKSRKRKPKRIAYGVSKQKLSLTPVTNHPIMAPKKRRQQFRISSESERSKKTRGEGNFRTRTLRPSVHVGSRERSRSVASRFIPIPTLAPRITLATLAPKVKRPTQIEVEPSPILRESYIPERKPHPKHSLLSAEPIMEVNKPIELRALPASLYNAPDFCKRCYKHWMEKAPTATDTELYEYCCVTGVNKRKLG